MATTEMDYTGPCVILEQAVYISRSNGQYFIEGLGKKKIPCLIIEGQISFELAGRSHSVKYKPSV